MKSTIIVCSLSFFSCLSYGQKSKKAPTIKVKEDVATIYYAKGKKSGQGPYIKNTKVGYWKHWHNNGKLASEGYYSVYDEKCGEWTFWTEDGTKMSSGTFEDCTHFEERLDSVDIKTLGKIINEGLVDLQFGRRRYTASRETKKGFWTYYRSDSIKEEEGTYDEKGKKTGIWTTWNKEGIKVSENRYENNKLNGTTVNWYHKYSGVKYSEGNYVDGDVSGAWTFYFAINEAKKEEGNYQEGKKTGEWTYWYTSGQKLATTHYESNEDGRIERYINCYDSLGNQIATEGNGRMLFLNDIGKLKMTGAIVDGVKDKTWELYTIEGKISAYDIYDKGEFVSGTSYDNDGKEYKYTVLEERSEPYGGTKAFYQWVGSNLKYPKDAINVGIEGKVYVQFIVDKDGSLTNIECVRGPGFGLNKESERIIKLAPKWKPAKQRGQLVKQRMILPINFRLN